MNLKGAYPDDLLIISISNRIFIQPVLEKSDQLTAQLTTSNPNGDDGWFVDWMTISAGDSTYSCPMSAWLDNDENRDNREDPSTIIVTCEKLLGNLFF